MSQHVNFFFYDLETSGVNPRSSRIMQFAGQRTDMSLKPIGEPYNILIKLTEDVLPEPDAILITGITPQKTLTDGISEAEFTKLFLSEIVIQGTIFVGFNSVRFDDEFMRFLLWRNFADPYEWQWKDGRSRWDIMDVARMTRALRPKGINWPFRPDGVPTVSLESLTSANKIDHADSHDALGDVNATIAVARLIKQKQPKLFDYLLQARGKKAVASLVNSAQPFVYTSGKYANDLQKTTVVQPLGPHPDRQGVLVYDLRHDPTPWLGMTAEQLAEAWKWKKDSTEPRVPVKSLQFNRCPAVAPLGVLDDDSKKRLDLDLKTIQKHRHILASDKNFVTKLHQALALLNTEREQATLLGDERQVDSQLYDGFVPDQDKRICTQLQSTSPQELQGFAEKLHDPRLKAMLPLYKARNFSKYLSDDEKAHWENYRQNMLKKSMPGFASRLKALGEQKLTPDKQYLLKELELYAQSIL